MKEDIVKSLSVLGSDIREYLGGKSNELGNALNDNMQRAYHENGWFTEDNIKQSLHGISIWLNEEVLSNWLSNYTSTSDPKNVGIIMAGNIPLVGFHDLLCVLAGGHKAIVKMSSQDKVLLPILIDHLTKIDDSFEKKISFVEKLSGYDAVIATGSNNSARYFEYYFREKPHIIRKNRNSIAVLNGNENDDMLKELGKDVFSYFGLGCRNVSKVLIPEDFDLNRLFAAFLPFSEVYNNKKYANNYDYYKAFYLLNKADLLENGFMLVKEDSSLYSPVSMLFYQRYRKDSDIDEILSIEKDNIQCVVSAHEAVKKAIPFGKSQEPAIDDYADGVDTLKFLSEL